MFDIETEYAASHPKILAVVEALASQPPSDFLGWAYKLLHRTDHYTGDDHVYFVEAIGTNLVKVGRSVNPARRLGQLQLLSPVPLRVVGLIHGGSEVETIVHAGILSLRSHGEWFHFTHGLRHFVRAITIEGGGAM
jgi:hypothetical protein